MGEAKRRKAAGEYPDANKKRQGGETFVWEVVGDTASHPKALQVLEIEAKLAAEHKGSSGRSMVVVLEDQARTPIIRITTKGLPAFLALISALQDLALTDRLEHLDEPERGVDAAFS